MNEYGIILNGDYSEKKVNHNKHNIVDFGSSI